MSKVKYFKKKINISIDSELLKKIDFIKNYPKWKGNRSLLIESIIEDSIMGYKYGK